ncbi:MAG: TusE/DsrC/DsvC family sulfur relay protein [Syntrophobacter sp.]
MKTFEYKGKSYEVDEMGFLARPETWDEDFAAGMAQHAGISSELTGDHLRVISFIRNTYSETGRCPLVYQVGKSCSLKVADLKRLFPAGYLRGACLLAGLTNEVEDIQRAYPKGPRLTEVSKPLAERTYTVDVMGFLIDHRAWDEEYAIFKAREMKLPELNEVHWQIMKFVREYFIGKNVVPTVYEVCEAAEIDLEDLGALFPDGYHRGVIKIAGLRNR